MPAGFKELLPQSQGESLHPQSRGVTGRRSPEVSSTAFDAQPPDLPPVSLMDRGFAIIGSLARHRRPLIRFLFIGSRLCSTSFRPRLAASVISPLRFTNPSSPSDWVEGFHLLAIEHAWHTCRRPHLTMRPFGFLTLDVRLSARVRGVGARVTRRLTR